MLYKLLSRLNRDRFQPTIISLSEIGPVGEKIQALEIPVRALRMGRGIPKPLAILQLATWLRQTQPDVIHTWMYHANLIGGLAAKLSSNRPVLWGIRQSNFNLHHNKRSTIWVIKLGAKLSAWLPTRILHCSEVSRQIHRELGYTDDKTIVIPNGFDTMRFRPDPAARYQVRQKLHIPENATLIGLVGRFDPQKDHRTFFEAAGLLCNASTRKPNLSGMSQAMGTPPVHFLLCGDGITWDNLELVQWIEAAGIGNQCHLLGRRDDIPALTAALDIATLSSAYGEAFPNAIGEAMSCGIPCVVTAVGDAPLIVGETGRVVPLRSPQALAQAWEALMSLDTQQMAALSEAARAKVIQCFSLDSIADQYMSLYEETAPKSRI